MHPFHRYTDSYPQTFTPPRDYNPYPYHYYPGWETIPPHLKVDPPTPRASSSFGPWPCNGTFNHPNPADHSNCCNHSYHPGYYNHRPLSPHIHPPHPQLYHHGPYPPYTDLYPPCFIQPPWYSIDQSLYDCKAKDHCCGCPNHTCPQRNVSTLKIEEQKPEAEQENNISSLMKLPGQPYPVVRIPPGYTKENEGSGNSDWHRWLHNGWAPVDDNNTNGMKQVEEKNQKWPIIWMPGYEGTGDEVKEKEMNDTRKNVEEIPPNFRITPLKLLENGNRMEKKDDAGNNVHTGNMAEKKNKIRIIPVKQMEEEKSGVKPRIVEKQNEEKEAGIKIGISDNIGVKKDNTKKSSKLRPVCLRVDPLPKKKSVNATSQSRSPNSLKENKSQLNGDEHRSTIEKVEEEVPKEEIQIENILNKSSKKVEVKDMNRVEEVPVLMTTLARADVDCEKLKTSDNLNEGDFRGENKKKGSVKASGSEGSSDKKMSEFDASVLIQSAYRGFLVRRCQLIEKLRKIRSIREQVANVRGQVESLEASHEPDTKERVVVGEIIMNLLLQLDAIQGSHPSVREIRKSLVRELTNLQDKLDSLSGQNESSEVTPMVSVSDDSVGGSEQILVAESVNGVDENGASLTMQRSIEAEYVDISDQMKKEEITPREALENFVEPFESGVVVDLGMTSEGPNTEEAEELPLKDSIQDLGATENPVEQVVDTEEPEVIEGCVRKVGSQDDKSSVQPLSGSVQLTGSAVDEDDHKQKELEVLPLLENDGSMQENLAALDTVESSEAQNDDHLTIVSDTSASSVPVADNSSLGITISCSNAIPSTLEMCEIFDTVNPDKAEERPISEVVVDVGEAEAEASAPAINELFNGEGKKLMDENEKLREMLEKLLEAGKQQLGVISDLNGRVKELERKFTRKKRAKVMKKKLAYGPSPAI